MWDEHAARVNGPRYWAALTINTGRYYARTRRPVAGLRALARTLAFGYYGELCERCGRPYPLWWCDDGDMWRHVAGHVHGGLLCLACFDQRARQRGIHLMWRPGRFPVVEFTPSPLEVPQ